MKNAANAAQSAKVTKTPTNKSKGKTTRKETIQDVEQIVMDEIRNDELIKPILTIVDDINKDNYNHELSKVERNVLNFIKIGAKVSTIRDIHKSTIKPQGYQERKVTINGKEIKKDMSKQKDYFEYIYAVGLFGFSYTQTTKYLNCFLSKDKLKESLKYIKDNPNNLHVEVLQLSHLNNCAVFANFLKDTMISRPENIQVDIDIDVENFVNKKEIDLLAKEQEKKDNEKRKSVSFLQDNSKLTINFLESKYKNSENACVTLMNVLLDKYVNKISSENKKVLLDKLSAELLADV